MLHLIRTLFISALLWSPVLQAALFEHNGTDLSRKARQAQAEGKILVVLFEQDDCEICQRLKRTVFSDPHTQRQFSRGYYNVSVNLSQQSEITTPEGKQQLARLWADQMGILGTPALAFFDAKGQLLYRHVGPVKSGAELLHLGNYVARHEFENQPFTAYLKSKTTKQTKAQAKADTKTPAKPQSKSQPQTQALATVPVLKDDICHAKN
ncbi:MAG: thioredoxin family protein [Azovibrio sp.]